MTALTFRSSSDSVAQSAATDLAPVCTLPNHDAATRDQLRSKPFPAPTSHAALFDAAATLDGSGACAGSMIGRAGQPPACATEP